MERRRYVTLATWAYERRQRIEDASIPHEHPGEASREAGDPTQPTPRSGPGMRRRNQPHRSSAPLEPAQRYAHVSSERAA